MVRRLNPTRRNPSALLDPNDPDVRAVIVAMEEIEACHTDLKWWADEIWAVGTRSDKLRRAWKQFQSAGGVTAADFRAFIRGGNLRGCTHHAEHLRVIVENPRPTVADRGPARPGDPMHLTDCNGKSPTGVFGCRSPLTMCPDRPTKIQPISTQRFKTV